MVDFRVIEDGHSIAESKCDILVNTVNCVNVMGKGVAKIFKDNFPHIMPDYYNACKYGDLKPGKSILFPLNKEQYWCAMATKYDWKYPSRLDWVENAIKELAVKAKDVDVFSIAMPPPGCGEGKLNIEEVFPIIETELKDFYVVLYLTKQQYEIIQKIKNNKTHKIEIKI